MESREELARLKALLDSSALTVEEYRFIAEKLKSGILYARMLWIISQIESLYKSRTDGAITVEEYETKKKELL